MIRSHLGCWNGTAYEHTCAVPLAGRTCIECGAPAGTLWGPHYCPPCDVIRLDGISASLEEIKDHFRTVTNRKSTP